MVNLEVLNPVADRPKRKFELAPRINDLMGKTIGLYWNAKPGGDIILERTAQLLSQKFRGTCLKKYTPVGSMGTAMATTKDLDTMAKECDAIIGTSADCGSCTSWLVRDMTELEKRGIPIVMWTGSYFTRDAQVSARAFGFDTLAMAVIEKATAARSPEDLHQMVDNSIDQVIDGLTKPVARPEAKVTLPSKMITIQGNDLLDATEKMNRQFLEEGWSDGFPLVPPTPQAVEQMLKGTHLSREIVLCELEPGNGIASVEKIAINAVMAGCRPEHMPVIITAVRCISEPIMCLRNQTMSTASHGLFILVNGPIAKELNMNSKCGALGPGSPSYANTVIGRALSLVIMNVGHAYPGVMAMGDQGSPLKYSMCVAENEEDTPWEPFHTEKGYDRNISTVSTMFMYGMCSFQDMASHTAEGLAKGLCTVVANVGALGSGLWVTGRMGDPRYNAYAREENLILLCPEHAQVFARDGWGKDALRQYLYDHARVPMELVMLSKTPESVRKSHPELTWMLDHPELPVPVVETPDCFQIAVVGGSGATSFYFEGARGMFTLPVEASK